MTRRAATIWAFAIAVTCVDTARADRGPASARDESADACDPPAELWGDVTLDPGCVYEANLRIEASDTTLDCAGALIRPERGRALRIDGELENITVRNCYLAGGGMHIRGPAREPGEDDDQLRARSPKNVMIEHVHVLESHMTGIFVGELVTGVTIRASIVENASSAGIYLEFGSQHIRIEDNLIRDNGIEREGMPLLDWWRREGIAVDASAFNEIVGNDIAGNAFGGVFLYKNCWEYHSTDPSSPERTQHAHSNPIEGNTFSDMPIGVWVAARQARDLGAWDCGDSTPYPNPIPLTEAFPPDYPATPGTFPSPYDVNLEYFRAALEGLPCPDDDCSVERDAVWIWPDFAENNVVRGNEFVDLELIGVRIEDDDATVAENLFLGEFEYVYLGTPFRARYLDQPVLRARIENNLFDSDAGGFRDHLTLMPGEHEDSTISGNTRACLKSGRWVPCPAEGCDCRSARTGALVLAAAALLWPRRRRVPTLKP